MITRKDELAMNLAERILKNSQHPKYRISAVLMKSGNVISTGINKLGSAKPFVKKYRNNLALHAEIDALIGIDKKVAKNSTLYVCGETANFNPINCKPCESCQIFCATMMVKRIVFRDKLELKEIK